MARSLLHAFKTDVKRFRLIDGLIRFPAFQFLFVAPTVFVFSVVLISTLAGIQHPAFNFGTVFTWVVWWTLLLFSFVFVGRGWCFVCPLGALGEWLQRLSLWWRSRFTAGYNWRWPGKLRNMWLATAFFLVFIWLDNGYGVSNSPGMTAGLIIVITLGSLWVGLFFERRTFCRYICPLTTFIGVSSQFAMLELRGGRIDMCRRCQTKDCLMGNRHAYGCPMFEYPGGGMDSNVYCILCGECVRSCPHDNIVLRFRPPGVDLWAKIRPRLDEATIVTIIVGLVTIVPLFLILFLDGLRSWLSLFLPAGIRPNDPPRLVAITLLFGLGIAACWGVAVGFSALAKLFSGTSRMRVRDFYVNYAYSLLPVGLFKFLGDVLDNVSRTWGSLTAVSAALLKDFPFNTMAPDRVEVLKVMGGIETYVVQTALALTGLGMSLYVASKISLRFLRDRKAAYQSLLPIAGLAFFLTTVILWSLSVVVL